MHYIVVDFEWNQPLSHRSTPFRRVGDRLMFEMIQIGAVKLNEHRQMTGSFSQLITPEHYMKLHPRIRRITGIAQEDLADAPPFLQAWEQFLSWAGEDAALLTWGGDDISVLNQNFQFFGAPGELPPFYDLQRLYSSLQADKQHRTGLQAALELYDIAPTEEHPFHNAVDDAYYTALVFQRMPEAMAVLSFPEKPREIGKPRKQKQGRTQSLVVRSEKAFFQGRNAMTAPCPVCGQLSEIPEGYVPLRGLPTALADCASHGLFYTEVMFEKNEDGHLEARRRCYLSEVQSSAYVTTKHLQWAQKIAMLQQKEESA